MQKRCCLNEEDQSGLGRLRLGPEALGTARVWLPLPFTFVDSSLLVHAGPRWSFIPVSSTLYLPLLFLTPADGFQSAEYHVPGYGVVEELSSQEFSVVIPDPFLTWNVAPSACTLDCDFHFKL